MSSQAPNSPSHSPEVKTEDVRQSIEAESDPYLALRATVRDSQRALNRELDARIELETQLDRLQRRRDEEREEATNNERRMGMTIYHFRQVERELKEEVRAQKARANEMEAERDRCRVEMEALRARLRTVTEQLAAARAPAPAAASPGGAVRGRGSGRERGGGRGGGRGRAGRGGRSGGSAPVTREQPRRVCKVGKNYKQ